MSKVDLDRTNSRHMAAPRQPSAPKRSITPEQVAACKQFIELYESYPPELQADETNQRMYAICNQVLGNLPQNKAQGGSVKASARPKGALTQCSCQH